MKSVRSPYAWSSSDNDWSFNINSSTIWSFWINSNQLSNEFKHKECISYIHLPLAHDNWNWNYESCWNFKVKMHWEFMKVNGRIISMLNLPSIRFSLLFSSTEWAREIQKASIYVAVVSMNRCWRCPAEGIHCSSRLSASNFFSSPNNTKLLHFVSWVI